MWSPIWSRARLPWPFPSRSLSSPYRTCQVLLWTCVWRMFSFLYVLFIYLFKTNKVFQEDDSVTSAEHKHQHHSHFIGYQKLGDHYVGHQIFNAVKYVGGATLLFDFLIAGLYLRNWNKYTAHKINFVIVHFSITGKPRFKTLRFQILCTLLSRKYKEIFDRLVTCTKLPSFFVI